MRIVWSDAAVADLKAISEYLEQDRSLATANQIVRRLYRAAQDLAAMPTVAGLDGSKARAS